jgi:hypothetical protein
MPFRPLRGPGRRSRNQKRFEAMVPDAIGSMPGQVDFDERRLNRCGIGIAAPDRGPVLWRAVE